MRTSDKADFSWLAEKMRAAAMPEPVISLTGRYFARLKSGASGQIAEDQIQPVDELPTFAELGEAERQAGREALPRTVLLKLNGGLGTGMGLERAKSLLQVKDGLSFLDIIARQARAAGIPLLLMNSFATREDSLACLSAYPELAGHGLPLDFLQHQIPKIYQNSLKPVDCPENRRLEWCPPGHGDLYLALVTSGVLEKLLTAGYRYAFVSNADNLGAVLDEAVLGYFASSQAPFMMEVARRMAADRKGGHLARRPDGGLLLREAAQCAPEDEAAFQDVDRYRYFNTNSLWLDLKALKAALADCDNLLELPLIVNRKTVDPKDSASAPVFQLETAMGSAIEIFAGALALEVPRSRFAPVKTTDDLLAVRSDAYDLQPDFRVSLAPELAGPPLLSLDAKFYRLLPDFEQRFAAGPPSLRGCRRLRVSGDITFGADLFFVGDVSLSAAGSLRLPSGLTIEGGEDR